MATIEKLIKAFEALKVFQPAVSAVEEVVVKKKEQPLSKNEKIANCNLVADCICAPNMSMFVCCIMIFVVHFHCIQSDTCEHARTVRSVADFPKFLGIAMETFLTLCDDPEADIRMVADECLNRSIKTLLETNLGRLQVELYKEIKKNGSPRCLRAALWRFADMAHLIRPQKCRPYIVNLLPCLGRICKREDEGIQETLMSTMQKICPALMVFANDTEVKVLLKAFLPNLSSSVASCRRTAATSLTLICQHSRSPQTFVNFLLVNLLEMVLPVDIEREVSTLLGVIQCMKNIIPIFSQAGSQEEGMKGSFGETKKNKETTLSKEQLLKVYQLLLHHTGHRDHNVVTVTLEALLQILRTPPPGFKAILTNSGSITETYIYKNDMPGLTVGTNSLSEVPSTSALSTTSEDTGLDDDSEMSEIKQDTGSLTDATSLDSALDGSAPPCSSVEGEIVDEQMTEKSPDSENDDGVMFVADAQYSGVEIGDIQEDQSQKSNLSKECSGSQETLLSIKSLSPSHVTQQPSIGQDLNGNPEVIIETDNTEAVSLDADTCQEDIMNNIGSVTDGLPLLYCVRLVCRRFLLSRKKGELVTDRQVRVSVKTLALGSFGCALNHLPSIFLEKLFTKDVKGLDEVPNIRDVLLYSSHSDPQLRGHTTLIIGSFINTVLIEGRGDFAKWLQQNNSVSNDCITAERLVEILLSIAEDISSVAARLAVGALKSCIPELLHSCHSDVGLRGLLKLLTVKNNNYWLVKVELLELIQCLDFKVIHHLETVCEMVKRGSHHYLGELGLQERFTEIVLSFLGDEDYRVRQCAAVTLVRMVPNLYYPLDHIQQDAVIALASSYTDHFLSPIMHEWSQQPPPLVQGLVKPYHVTPKAQCQHVIESSLSRIVMSVLLKLQLSRLKHLTSGCCLSLCLLSEEYLTSTYPHAWGCGTSTPLVAKETSQKCRRPPTRSLSSSSTLSLEELTSGSGGLLPIILSLLTSSPVTLDLSSHQSALQLAGNLIAGSVYQCLRSPDTDHSKTELGTSEESTAWSALSNRALVPIIDQLLIHVARVLNVFAHVIDEIVPGPPQMKTSLPSLPQAPSLSPIKRRAKGEKDTGSNPGTPGQDSKTAQKQSQKDKDKELEKERNKKEGLGTFYTLPHYVKLYDTLKGAYSNYKISLDLTSSDKFCTMLKTALHVLSQILEVAALSDIGKYAEEFLSYMRTTVSLEPTDSVLCVQQLLKALFGTNLCSQWEEQYVSTFPRKQAKSSKLPSHAGLYHCTLSQPYSLFTQTLAAATIKAISPDHEDTSGMLTWLRKCVERKIPAILKPSSKADKTAIAAYIRLFEPLVIKALKQYTVTSSLELQEQVLDLLSQLVQLRVNYCLLDSDQVFIGFVIKQFEYIEEGQIRNSEILIPHIFNFLVMLSYEKFHSKTIINMPKIIQLCDGIMASGLHPTTHAIPALQPIVHDLFLLRGANKSDISKELETQREVLVSMLLRLINYYQALEMFVLVLQQCHRESEERWKRLSRQVTDILLPALARQQINLNSQVALDVVHRLFESVAPIVFRPVDILLKTLLMPPADISSGTGLERWLCLVLSILRVLMAQTKEEVVLSRIQELGIKLHIFKGLESEIPEAYRSKIAGMSPEYIMAWFLLNIIGKTVDMINTTSLESRSCDFLCKQLSHLLMYITHMFQSGLFRRIATASVKVIHQPTLPCHYDIKEINKNFLLLGMSQPTLTLQFCNVLILLNFNDQAFWSEVIRTPKRKVLTGSKGDNTGEGQSDETGVSRWHCCNLEVLRRGGLILFCDYACENLNDSEHMTWVLINHIKDLIELAHENPVQDFISAIHRNSSASSLFIQAIHARWEDVKRPSVIYKTLKCLEAIHPSQSGALLILLIDKFLHTHHLAVARLCDTIACRRLEQLLADTVEESSKQLPADDLDKLLSFMDSNKLNDKHMRLSSLLYKFREKISGDTTHSAESSTESQFSPLESSQLQVDKVCYLSIVKEQCFTGCPDVRECAYLLQHLDYADMLMIMMTKEFNLSVLEECISFGAYKTIQRHSREAETPSIDGARVDWMFDPLFQASQLTLIRHINNIINQLPVPHQILCLNDQSSDNNQYFEKMEDLFTDHSCVEEIFQLMAALVQYLTGLARFPWKPAMPKESQSDVCRFCTLAMECVCWSVHHNNMPTSGQLCTSLQCLSLVLQNQRLSTLIGLKDHVTWVCSITNSVYQLVSSLLLLPGEKLCLHTRKEESGVPKTNSQSLALQQLTRACDEVSELVQYLHLQQTTDTTTSLSKLPGCMSGLVSNIILGLSRIPVLNSFARTPPIVWKIGWVPTPTGEPATKLPPLPIDLMLDKEVLKEFIFRINSIGWISRQQFEETWMSLLGVLVPVTPEHPLPIEEDIERTHCMVLTVRAITGMLTQTILVPSPGNPARGTFDVQPRDKPLGFLHTRCGKKLSVIRGIVEQEVRNMMLHRVEHVEHGEGVKYKFDHNLEREAGVDDYSLGQICIESIWSVVGVLDTNLSESDTTDSLESPPPNPQDGTLLQNLGSNSVPEQEGQQREQTSSLGDLDVHSCLQFLLDLYRQWLLPGTNGKPALMLLNEVIKSVVSLSDLFAEREQYDWMLDTLFEVYKSHPGEDEIAMQYLNVGVCKAAAVVGVDSTTADKLVKIIANGLKSTHLASKVSTLHGCLYLLEAAIPEVNKLLVPALTDFLLKNISNVSNQSISSQKYVLTMWATAFFIIENCTTDLKDADFTNQILQLAVSMASSSEDSISSVVYVTILKGLERLLLTNVLTPQDAEVIVKLSVDRLCLPSPQRALAGLGLLFTCMYSGKQYDQYSPRPREQEAFSMEEPTNLYQDPESLIVAMERVTVLFDRIKKGYPYEARVIARVLPAFLADFFPPQDIMNKVIGEFLSSQQPYPQLIAKVVFQVFSNLHDQRQQGLLKDWVMLSLSNFTQRTPVSMAMWSLTCFFISASTNAWLRNLFSYVLSRMGKIEAMDKRLFCLAAMDFYQQVTDAGKKRAFLSTFQGVASSMPDSPYRYLLDTITKQNPNQES